MREYSKEPRDGVDGMKKFFQTLEGVGVHHNQPVKYLSPDEIYFHWDPQDTWYPETINVLLNWEKRTKKRRFISDCFETRTDLKVFRKTKFWFGELVIEADRLEWQ